MRLLLTVPHTRRGLEVLRVSREIWLAPEMHGNVAPKSWPNHGWVS
jgi:hypothetical protein